MNWRTANDAAKWIPLLNEAEIRHGIPKDLLARECFEECSFDPEVITDVIHSSADCLGIMQLNPKYFPNAGKDPTADIEIAAAYLASLNARFKDWQLALAAYDWGPSSVHHWLEYGGPLPAETLKYVKQIVADVPVAGQIFATPT